VRFVIIGAGGVGGYFGARLAAAGNEVSFVARGAHRQAMENGGLRVLSPKGDLHIARPKVCGNPGEAGPCDVALICVKMADTAAVAEAVRPVLDGDTAVISLQNGVEAEDMLTQSLGRPFVMGGVAYIAAHIEAPGVVRHGGAMARIAFGELDGKASRRQDILQGVCAEAAIDADATGKIHERIWRKFAMLAPLAGATCLARCPVGAVRDDPALAGKLEAMVGEAVALARARGVALAEGMEGRVMAQIGQLPWDMKTSMLHDLEAGRRLELPWLNGAIVRLGAEAGIETPANAEVVAALTLLVEGAA
jgi:2-dehydropantoate 2-reductase